MPFIELSVLSIVTRVVAGLIVGMLLGALLALVALWTRDPGPKHDGRLTLNPFAHSSVWTLVATVAALVGWTNILRIDVGGRVFDRARPALLALAGEMFLLLLGFVIVLLRPLAAIYWPQASAGFVITLIDVVQETSFGFALLNLLPVPPLLAGYVVQSLHPPAFESLARHATIIAIALAVISLPFHSLVTSNAVALLEAW